MSTLAKAIVFKGVQQVEVVSTEIPAPEAGELLLETLFTCVSPGTELRCLRGLQPDLPVEPYIPGYANVGRVIEAGDGCVIPVGSVVLVGGTQKASVARLWGAHVSHAVVRESSAILLPNGIDPLEASFTRLAAISYRGFQVAQIQPGEAVAVIGMGPIGQSSARIFHAEGADVVALDINEKRLAIVAAQGIRTAISQPTAAEALNQYHSEGADVVVDASGSAVVLRQAIECAKTLPWTEERGSAARLIVQGSHPADIAFDYHAAFFKELAIHFPRDSKRSDMEAVLSLLAQRKLQLRDLITEVAKPEDAADVYARLQSDPSLITVAFDWR